MKNRAILSFSILICVTSFLSAQTTIISDVFFEDYLETHAIDGTLVSVGDANSMGDGIANNALVLTNRINTVTFLDVSDLGISDLNGIGDFIELETLICSNNNLSNLDISNNTNLVSLLCSSNFLSSITVSNNLNLESLNCSDNLIQDLDLTSNLALESLTASDNQIVVIDVSNNANLNLLGISNNRITGDLLVGNNLDLESLFCSSNQITGLDLSANTVLKNLDVSNNALTSLDLSFVNSVVCPDPQTDPLTLCQGLSTINVSRNQLTSLIVANGYNNLFATINSIDNPDLFCIQIDSGFTPSGWIKDDWTYYSENTCVDIYTYVPDDNFEQALIDDGYDDILDNLVLTENIYMLTSIDVSNEAILSLVGIEDFSALEILDCSTNTIESLDLSNNTALLQLDVTNNDLTALDISTNTILTTLYCASNLIETIDLSNNTALTTLNCSSNILTSIDVSSNIFLSDLDVSFNQIESLDVIANVSLTSLLSNDNNLFALNLNNGTNNLITTFNATNNIDLFCIEVDDVAFANATAGWQKDVSASYNINCGTYVPDDNFEQELIDLGIDSDGTLNNFVATIDINTLMSLDISNLGISDLTGIQDFVALQDLNCSINNLTILDLGNNTALEILDASNNQIEDLDLVTNTTLTSVLCNNNALLTLNIENGNNNLLTTFNATNNPTLFCINIDDAIVGSIPGSWQKDSFATYNGDCANNRFTAIPDAFFEQTLIDLGYDDVIDSQVLTSNIEHVQDLNVSDQSISDLTGIQDFKALLELDCSGNFLNDLDVSGMLFLERLNCSSNNLQTNDISDTNGLFNTTGTLSLKELYCASNNLNNLDTSQNTNLELLDCADNNLSTLNIDSNSVLSTLNCSNNNLTTLDISTNINLEEINCNNNSLNTIITVSVPNMTLTNLSCANNNLSDVLVNNYQALENLNCSSNTLTQIDVTSNTALSFLSLTNNQISDINLLNNLVLVEVSVSQNSLTQLNITANDLLENLNCSFNEITQLDLGLNSYLEVLFCTNNQLTDLDLSSNSDLIEVDFSTNMISSLILSNNLGTLKRLNASSNQIENDLDLTTMATLACVFQSNQTEFCPETISINVSNNLLSFINLQNGINADISSFNASGNPNLDCIQVDDADNVSASWVKDEATTYSEDCNFGETYVPDDNFEQALINLGYDSGPLNDYVLTANIEALTSLDVSANSIADMTGIEDFEALENLNCSNNTISEIDVSLNTNLLSLDCSNNLLADLVLENNTALIAVNCSGNVIASIELTTNTNLLDLNIADNAFTDFSPSEVLSLQDFNCDNNGISELDFQQNQALTSLTCQSNVLETLNIRNGQNAILNNLNAEDNLDLVCIETDDGTVPIGATWIIDATAQFAVNCFFGQTFVPDDNFEQALIDLGYDSGPLDDYVSTDSIEAVNFLDVEEREISDLTGIEAFTSLTSLNFSENTVAMVDLSTNGLLVNLDASGNLLTDLNLILLSNLTRLDVSNNSLTSLNFETNLSLVDLNISNNVLTSIEVGGLLNLEELNCALNQLSSINITQNTNMTLLFCQSNLLIADQLNLQNGNNENLQLFNASNNPDLACILVDDPAAVISNEDGLYDNWIKDDTSNYQIICEDADNDGIPNEDDLCPSTEFGATVDLFGCAVLNLPNDNFTILITGETCLNSNNGKITITAQEIYSYTATLIGEDILEGTGEVFYQDYNFTNDVDIFNLLAGNYEMCITIEEWPDYQSCYTIVITEPDPLVVFANRTASGDEVSIALSGSTIYTIEFNGDTFTTHNSTITLQLQQGLNTLKVRTDKECQGTYEETIFMTDRALVYPNPFNNHINLYVGKEGENVSVKMYSSYGQLVLNKTYVNQDLNTRINTNGLLAGMYFITVQTKTQSSVHKIIKE